MAARIDTTSEIVTASGSDLPRVADTLADAFYDDPVFTWLCPDPERRKTVLPGWFSVITERLQHHGSTHVVSGGEADGAGAAVWTPPDRPMVDDPEALARAIAEVSPADAERFGALFSLADEHHPEETHWYLFLMGVTVERQGQGLGSKLLRAVLDDCDREGIPAYLEATCERNARLYARHGFEVTGELSLPDGPTGFAMWRDPVSSTR